MYFYSDGQRVYCADVEDLPAMGFAYISFK